MLGEGRSWWQFVLLDSPVEQGRLFERGNAQLLVQYPYALPVLAKGGSALVGPRVECHEHPVGRLVQGVHGQLAPGVGYRRLPLAQRRTTTREPLQSTGQLLAQALGLEKLPVVEGDAVAQAENGHEIVVVQRNSLGQRRQASWAHL